MAEYKDEDDFYFYWPPTNVKDKALQIATGLNIYNEENAPRITPSPIPNQPDMANENILKLLNTHNAKHSGYQSRILRQRASLVAIPITEVDLTYKEKECKAWVYGMEKSVYCPKMSCCSCSCCTII